MVRDIAAVLGAGLMALALGLWEPLVGLFALGLMLVVGAWVASWLNAAPEKESDDGAG